MLPKQNTPNCYSQTARSDSGCILWRIQFRRSRGNLRSPFPGEIRTPASKQLERFVGCPELYRTYQRGTTTSLDRLPRGMLMKEKCS